MAMAPSHPGEPTPLATTPTPAAPAATAPAAAAPTTGAGDVGSADPTRWAALAAAATGVLSILYAVGYLLVAPSAQRGSDVDEALRSLASDPWGMRVAAGCLVAAGLTSGIALTALRSRLAGPGDTLVAWATMAGVAGGLASAAHGLGEIVALERLAERYLEGDDATRAAGELAKAMPSPVDPLGLFTFAVAGLVALAFASRLRPRTPRLGLLGLVYGVDLLALFALNAAGVDAAVLVTGALASLVVGPIWWWGVAHQLRAAAAPLAGPLDVSSAARPRPLDPAPGTGG